MIKELLDKWELQKDLDLKMKNNKAYNKFIIGIISGIILLTGLTVWGFISSFSITGCLFCVILHFVLFVSLLVIISNKIALKREIKFLNKIKLFEIQAHINEITHLKYVDKSKAENNEQ